MEKATWPSNFVWTEVQTNFKLFKSPDDRLVVQLTRKYVVPEIWNVQVFVYGPGGSVSARMAHLDWTDEGPEQAILSRARKATLATGLVEACASNN
jgi:hypothetical protein